MSFLSTLFSTSVHETMTEDKKKTKMKISGMTCATCVNTIEKTLSNLDGVIDIKVNLAGEYATVEYYPNKLKITDIEKAVKNVGYNIANEQVILNIGGMTCAMCVQTIEKALKNLDGVISVDVNLGAEKVYITYNPKVVTITDMKAAIEVAGYQYLGVEGADADNEDLEKIIRKKELREKRRRFIIGFSVGIPLMILMYIPLHLPSFMPYIMLIVSAPVFVYVSHPIFLAAYRALKNQTLNVDVMYSMGIGVAFISSVLGTFEVILSREFLFYEASIILASFLTFGRYLEARAKSRTSESIRKLVGLQPKTATVLRDEKEISLPIEEVKMNDTVIVKPGEKIPVDGDVIEGKSYIDEAMITGEPIPILKKKGNNVIGGTINKNSIIILKTTKIGKDTVLSQIIKLVEQAQGSKPSVQRVADKVVRYFIPVVLSIAILSFIVWYFILDNTLLFALTRLISVLVIACPCALGLATPTAVTVGIGRGAELGILIKNGEVLELSEKLTTVVFDKTGTLTEGKPEVTDIVIGGETDEKSLLEYAASVEKNSQHPLAKAVVRRAKLEGINLCKTRNFNTIEGKGVRAEIDGKEAFIGNEMFMKENKIAVPIEIEEKRAQFEKAGKSVAVVAIDKKIHGLIAIADTLKRTTSNAIKELRKLKLKVIMITGDNKTTAHAIADKIGIEHVVAEVLPQDKAIEVRKMQENGEKVAFVGDGVNDAPALAQADVGIAIGGGTDVAIESGEMILMKDDMIDAAAAIQLGRKVMSRIKTNLFWAFAYNTVLIPIAAGLLHPFFGIAFRPEFAGFAMAMSSVTVVTLSLMLKKYVPSVKREQLVNSKLS